VFGASSAPRPACNVWSHHIRPLLTSQPCIDGAFQR
jgi:hypothetical protein